MTLREKQSKFASLIPHIINDAIGLGFEVTLGECYRSPEEAARLAKAGLGIKNSLHCQRLAIDINLFLNGKYLTKSEDYKQLGDMWETKSGEGYTCHWGGNFVNNQGKPKPDGNHFSIGHLGRK